jgi:hypothetical protein
MRAAMTYADRPITRRTFLRRSAAGAGALGIASVVGFDACSRTHASPATPTAHPAPTGTPIAYRTLHSRPDLNGAPGLKVTASNGKAQDGAYILLTPLGGAKQGPAIFDNRGRLIWFQPAKASDAANLQVVKYKGDDVLAWWEGDVNKAGYGQGAIIFCDERYREVARITTGDGGPIDLHELVVTPQDTALLDVYVPTTMDLRSYGGDEHATVFDCRLQEVDIATGDVLFTWNALDHIGIGESVVKPTTDGSGYDFFHLNAIEVDTDGNLLISARNTSALYKLDRKSGEIIWRFGGAGNELPPNIALSPGSETFWFQHDIRRNPDGALSIFDDGGGPYHHPGRGLIFDVDEDAHTATIRQSYGADMGLHISYQGSFRRQENGNWLVGWGDLGRLTEFTPDGDTALDVTFTGNSYRALPAKWKGRPAELPAVAASKSARTAWASWNGATDVARWRLLGGADAGSLATLGTFDWHDFETAIPAKTDSAMFAVEALDAGGSVLARSAPVTAAA